MIDTLWMLLSRTLWPARLVLSVLVTLHVLRTKRDVGSAIGWIGLAWLAPLTGTALYVMFGVNRVRRLARRLGRARNGKLHLDAAPGWGGRAAGPAGTACPRASGSWTGSTRCWRRRSDV